MALAVEPTAISARILATETVAHHLDGVVAVRSTAILDVKSNMVPALPLHLQPQQRALQRPSAL